MRGRSFVIGALSDIGSVKKSNQDNILAKVGENESGDFGLFVVADGMGGLAAGEKASEIAVNEFEKWWDESLTFSLSSLKSVAFGEIDRELDQVFKNANNRIQNLGKTLGDRTGTTLSMLFIYGNQYVVKHIGDSRVYIANTELVQLTEDHSWVAQQVREGKMSRDEGKNHPKRNIITQCLGLKRDINIFTTCGNVKDGDTFLVCSDGFYNHLEDIEIVQAVREYRLSDADVQDIAAKLFNRVKERGASDNASAIIVCQDKSVADRGIISKIRGMMR